MRIMRKSMAEKKKTRKTHATRKAAALISSSKCITRSSLRTMMNLHSQAVSNYSIPTRISRRASHSDYLSIAVSNVRNAVLSDAQLTIRLTTFTSP